MLDADLGTGAFGDASDLACTCTVSSTEPACTMAVELYDDVAGFPLAAEDKVVDTCGRYRFTNVETPVGEQVWLVTKARPGDSTWVAVGSWANVEAGATLWLDGWSLSSAMDAQWSAPVDAELGGETFSQRGVFVQLFAADDAPVAGVTATMGGTPQAHRDFYFSDADDRLTTVDAARTKTGANGAALVVNQPVGQVSGTGAEPAGCSWESELGVSLPGWVLVRRFGPTACASARSR